MSERRREERLMASEGAFAAIESSSKAGQIIDISKGGICFRYIDDRKDSKSESQTEKPLSLVSMASYVGELDYKIVGDYPVLNISPFSSMEFRRCHVQFADLDDQKTSELDYYIHKNVVR